MNEKLKKQLELLNAADPESILFASTGAALSAFERYEQLYKHGFSLSTDAQYYKAGELVQAAMFCINPKVYKWPEDWGYEYQDKILRKSPEERLIIAAAFLNAEFDRVVSSAEEVEVVENPFL